MKFLILLILFVSCAAPVTKEAPKDFKGPFVGVVNLKVDGQGDLKSLMNKLESWVKIAKNAGAEIVLFPELVTLELFPVNPPDSQIPNLIRAVADQRTLFEKRLTALAKNHEVLIVGASTYVKNGSKRFFNRSYIAYPDGKLKYQDKNYPTPWEKKFNVSKTRNIRTFKYKDFKFVVLTCHDAEFPAISKKLTRIKPEVIFVPSMTDSIHGLNRVSRTSQARAIEHMSYVFMTGTSNDDKAAWHTYKGKNFLFTPQNKYFNEPGSSGFKEELTVYALDLAVLRESRADKSQVYPARDE